MILLTSISLSFLKLHLLLLFPTTFPLEVGHLTTNLPHLSLPIAPTYPPSSVSSYSPPSFFVVSYLTCCTHLDLDLPLGCSALLFTIKTSFVILSSFTLLLVCLLRCLTLDSLLFFHLLFYPYWFSLMFLNLISAAVSLLISALIQVYAPYVSMGI